jgi:outer membrane protein
MKKILLTLAFVMSICGIAVAQRYAIVDSKYILDKMPDYKTAQKQLDQISVQWQKEIDDKQAILDKMYKDFEGEEVMLSDDLKKKRD